MAGAVRGEAYLANNVAVSGQPCYSLEALPRRVTWRGAGVRLRHAVRGVSACGALVLGLSAATGCGPREVRSCARLPPLHIVTLALRSPEAALNPGRHQLPLGSWTALTAPRWTVHARVSGKPLRCTAVSVAPHWLLTSAHCVAELRQEAEVLHPRGQPSPDSVRLTPSHPVDALQLPPDRNGCGTDLVGLHGTSTMEGFSRHRGINQVKPDERLHLLDTGSARPRLLSLTVTCQAGRCPGRACNDAIATASAPVTAGTSGGGVYDRTGLLVGLVSRTSEDGRTVFVTDLATVTDWLSALPGRTPELPVPSRKPDFR